METCPGPFCLLLQNVLRELIVKLFKIKWISDPNIDWYYIFTGQPMFMNSCLSYHHVSYPVKHFINDISSLISTELL